MNLAMPTQQQYQWHERERIMFVCLDPATWQGREYDNHSVPLEQINPSALDTRQWCQAALNWGAKTILFVAKHAGGFCWWRTDTSRYGIKETAWKEGRGDVLAELAESCRQFALKLAVYLSPSDDTWGAYVGGGGRTLDPKNNELYAGVYRRQLYELLTRYGEITEVWFDGSIAIPVGDILCEYAPDAMIFQGPQATIRWAGTEKGEVPYPSWNAVFSHHLKTGISTAYHSDPDGDAWAPLEADTTLYDHYWFWSPEKEEKRKTLEQLMACYYKSIGRGAVLLLNSSPDTTGLIPEADMRAYKAFGDEIERRFANPVARTAGEGDYFEVTLDSPGEINHAVIMEDYRQGEKIREYVIECEIDGKWREVVRGSAVGRKKIDVFNTVSASRARLRIIRSVCKPCIRDFSLYRVSGVNIRGLLEELATNSALEDTLWVECARWSPDTVGRQWTRMEIDLSEHIVQAGRYEIKFFSQDSAEGLEIKQIALLLEGQETPGMITPNKEMDGYMLNRTAVSTGEESTRIRFIARNASRSSGSIRIRPKY
jgi:alpha-L-fucosidase